MLINALTHLNEWLTPMLKVCPSPTWTVLFNSPPIAVLVVILQRLTLLSCVPAQPSQSQPGHPVNPAKDDQRSVSGRPQRAFELHLCEPNNIQCESRSYSIKRDNRAAADEAIVLSRSAVFSNVFEHDGCALFPWPVETVVLWTVTAGRGWSQSHTSVRIWLTQMILACWFITVIYYNQMPHNVRNPFPQQARFEWSHANGLHP